MYARPIKEDFVVNPMEKELQTLVGKGKSQGFIATHPRPR
jgi:hypothetical protein